MATRMYLDSLRKTVTTAGTAVPLSAESLPVSSFTIRAKASNTGLIYVGKEDVDNSKVPLQATEAVSWEGTSTPNALDLSEVYIDASVDGEGVDVFYVTYE